MGFLAALTYRMFIPKVRTGCHIGSSHCNEAPSVGPSLSDLAPVPSGRAHQTCSSTRWGQLSYHHLLRIRTPPRPLHHHAISLYFSFSCAQQLHPARRPSSYTSSIFTSLPILNFAALPLVCATASPSPVSTMREEQWRLGM